MAMIRGASLALVLSLGLGGLAGCVLTKGEAAFMQADIDKLKAKQTRLDAQAAGLRKATEEADAQIKKMRELLDEATKVVTRNSANLGQDVDKLKSDNAAIQGRLDDMNTALTGLQKSFETFRASTDTSLEKLTNATTVAKAPPIPETPDAVFAEAKKRLEAKQWNDARRLFDAFIARYASDMRAASAQYMIGESYFSEGKYANAIGAYSKVIDNFPKSEVVPDAMYRNGQAFYALKYCGDARIYFQELLRRYPRTGWKKDANDQLKKIGKDIRNKALCQS